MLKFILGPGKRPDASGNYGRVNRVDGFDPDLPTAKRVPKQSYVHELGGTGERRQQIKRAIGE